MNAAPASGGALHSPTCPVDRPRSLDEALALRAEHPDASVLAGGTDLMVSLELGAWAPTRVLDLWRVAELRGIATSPEGLTRVGALCTWTDVARSSLLPGALRDAARTVGAPQIQNRGTVGGNIVNASPAGDSLPMWLALDAELELRSTRGVRTVPASAFWLAYRRTALAHDELLTAVLLPPRAWAPAGPDHLAYRKVGTRLAQAISKVVLGGRLRVEGGVVMEARVALGSVAPVPLRLPRVEAALVGRPLAEAPAAAELVAADIHPIDDIRSTADYRLRVARNVVHTWLASVPA